MRPTLALASLALAALASLPACGSGEQTATPGNDTARINNQIAAQAQEIAKQADSGAAEIERALENESAAMFENREALLNEGSNTAAAGNRSR